MCCQWVLSHTHTHTGCVCCLHESVSCGSSFHMHVIKTTQTNLCRTDTLRVKWSKKTVRTGKPRNVSVKLHTHAHAHTGIKKKKGNSRQRWYRLLCCSWIIQVTSSPRGRIREPLTCSWEFCTRAGRAANQSLSSQSVTFTVARSDACRGWRTNIRLSTDPLFKKEKADDE